MATEIPIKIQIVKSLSTANPSRIVAVKADNESAFSLFVTDKTGIPYPLKDLQNNVIITNTDGNLQITSSSTSTNINLASSILATINSALQSGDNISELVNDVGYLTTFIETDPIFQASEASLFVSGDKVNLDNQSNVNSGDQTSIVGISGTKAQFNTELTDGDFLFVGDVIGYTNEEAQDAVGIILTDTTTIDFTYDDTTPTISAIVKLNSIDANHLSNTINNSEFVNDSNYTNKTYVDSLVVGLLDDRGSYDASVNTFPTTGGSGTVGTILKGDIWYVSVAGVLAGQIVNVGDSFRALVDSPAQVLTNWAILEANIGYVPENVANKSTNIALGTSNILYPTQNAVKTYVDSNPNGYISDVNLSYTPSPTNGIVVNDKGTDATIPTVDFTNAGLLTPEEKQLLYNNSATGVTKFGGFSINADTTKYNTGLIEGWFVDNTTNPNIPTKVFKSFPATTGNTLSNIATQNVTYIAVDINGVHQQSGVPFEPEAQRPWIPLGAIVHSNRTNINAVNNQPVVALSSNNQLSDLMESIGFFNISGNVFTPNGVNLSINKSSGHVFKQGANFINNNKDPHTLALASLIAPSSLRYRTQTGTESANTNVIDAGFYDLAGVRTAIPGTRWSIQRIYLFQSNLVRIQYGQATYTTQAEAIQAITTEPFVVEQNILENGLFRALLIVREGATDLTDINRALFIEASKFGSVAGLGSLSTTNLQQAYNNSLTPEITTNSTLGAVSIKRGSTADTDNVFEIENGAGTSTATIKGNGALTALTYNGYIPENVANKDNGTLSTSTTTYPTSGAVKTVVDLKVDKNTAITGATNTKITYDSKGLVTAGTSLVAGDIPNIAESQVTNLVSDLALKAPLASPTFTGTPTLPTGTIAVTQTAGNNTTAIATTAFATTALNLKANLASPTLTGIPLAPTATAGTNTTQIATTAFVLANGTTTPDATITVKGKIKLAGDLGGTADLPTTPTAVHKTGVESIAGVKTFTDIIVADNGGDGFTNIWNNTIRFGTANGSQAFALGESGFNGSNAGVLFNASPNLVTNSVLLNTSLITSQKTQQYPDESGIFALKDNNTPITATSFINSTAPATNALLANGTTLAVAPLTGGTGYIQNQNASAQSANMWISGVSRLTSIKATGRFYSTGDSSFDDLTSTMGAVVLSYDPINIVSNITSRNYFTSTNLPLQFQASSYSFLNGAATFASTVTASNGTLIGGTGTSGFISKWTGAGTQGNSSIQDFETYVTLANSINIGKDTNGIFYNATGAYGHTFYTNSGSNRALDILNNGNIQINNLSGTGTRTVVADASGNLSAVTSVDSRPYKVYTALLTQTGTSAPTAIVLENTLGGTIVWTRTGIGVYRATLAGAFVINKVAHFITSGSSDSFKVINRIDSNIIQLASDSFSASPSDGIIGSDTIEIRVYN